MKLVNLQCPNCGGTLSKEGDNLVCHACGGIFSIDYDESDVEYENPSVIREGLNTRRNFLRRDTNSTVKPALNTMTNRERGHVRRNCS